MRKPVRIVGALAIGIVLLSACNGNRGHSLARSKSEVGSTGSESPKITLRIAAAQIPVTLDVASNVTTISRAMEKAIAEKADVLLTPEGSLSGYTHKFDQAQVAEGLDKLDVSELPSELIGRSQKPLLFGFKYLHHPYLLVLDIKKHEEIPVISTVIDSASGVTLFTADGKLVNRLIYKVRNTSKQFLELSLPPQAEVWSVFVGREPARPRLKNSKILIPHPVINYSFIYAF